MAVLETFKYEEAAFALRDGESSDDAFKRTQVFKTSIVFHRGTVFPVPSFINGYFGIARVFVTSENTRLAALTARRNERDNTMAHVAYLQLTTEMYDELYECDITAIMIYA